jgi:hypothetical protein
LKKNQISFINGNLHFPLILLLVTLNYLARLNYNPWGETVIEYYYMVSNQGLLQALINAWEGYIPAFPVFSAQLGLLLELSPEEFATFTRLIVALSVGLLTSLNGFILAKFLFFLSISIKRSLVALFVLLQNVMFLHPSLGSISILGYLFITPAITYLLFDFLKINQFNTKESSREKKQEYLTLHRITYTLLIVALLSKTNLIFVALSVYILIKKNRAIGTLAILIQIFQISQITSYGYPSFWTFGFVQDIADKMGKIVLFGLETLFNSTAFSIVFVTMISLGIILRMFQRGAFIYFLPLVTCLVLGSLPWMVEGNSLDSSSVSRLKMQHFVLPTFIMLCYVVGFIALNVNRLPIKMQKSFILSLIVFTIFSVGPSSQAISNDVEATGMDNSERCKLYPPLVGWSREATTEVRSSIWTNCVVEMKFNKFMMVNNTIFGFEEANDSFKDFSERRIEADTLFLIFLEPKGVLEKCNNLKVLIPNQAIQSNYSRVDYRKSSISGLYYLQVSEKEILNGDLSQLKLQTCDKFQLSESDVQIVALY